ncbi:MAG: SDR family oxidoreductase [Nitrospira sp.]|nr:SDR family oxidoreductase [Nitrospira sp.]
MRLKDKIAVITGGGRGIGKAIALAMAGEGADVVVLSRTITEIEDVAAKIRELGRQGSAWKVDVKDEAQVRETVRKIMDQYGRVDVLVNNAGVVHIQPLIETSIEYWEKTLSVNLTGTFLITKYILPQMIRRKSGCIINIASEAGLKGFANFSAYCTAKFGLIGLTKALAKEMESYHINVNTICPALVGTKMSREVKSVKEWKLMQPKDIADVAVFLATPEARAINGTAIEVLWRTL